MIVAHEGGAVRPRDGVEVLASVDIPDVGSGGSREDDPMLPTPPLD
jgi:hypothetical protein